MALIVGTRLGPYEIVAPIGAGGMGEVYRACALLSGTAVDVRRRSGLTCPVASLSSQRRAKVSTSAAVRNATCVVTADPGHWRAIGSAMDGVYNAEAFALTRAIARLSLAMRLGTDRPSRHRTLFHADIPFNPHAKRAWG